MRRTYSASYFLVTTLALLVLWGVYTRNYIVSTYEDVLEKAANIETQLQRRSDLIPNLVSTVKAYAEHEQEVFTAIADARTKLSEAINSNDITSVSEASNELDSAISKLFAVVEDYPDLKSNKNFIALQDELAGTENRIQRAREEYNSMVKRYNKSIKAFPNSFVANSLGYEEADYFESTGSSEMPSVNFD